MEAHLEITKIGNTWAVFKVYKAPAPEPMSDMLPNLKAVRAEAAKIAKETGLEVR